MLTPYPDLKELLCRYEQEHILAFWERLTEQQQRTLVAQLEAIDLALLRRLYQQRDKIQAAPSADRIEPVPVIPADAPEREQRRAEGQALLRQGKLAVLLVAGGQGSRLGFDQPKGMYPVGPLSGKSLFQIHAEKVLALSRRYGQPVPFLIMTSPATHTDTVGFFEQHQWFGLPKEEVFFFQQGTMPALDLATGRLLLESPGSLFLSPDGHGGTLTALARSGLLEQMKSRGIEHIFYFQVDNPLVRIGDPEFLGHHLAARSQVSSKVVAKRSAQEKVGVFARVDGRCAIVEYSDLPEELALATDDQGKLKLWAGNPAIHLFDVAFLEQMTRDPEKLPFHLARKKVPCLGADGQLIDPPKENALKFERFIFDTLPAAERWLLVETTRASEFAPLKNASGEDSPATVEAAILALARDWLEQVGAEAGGKVEISPLYALDVEELATKVFAGTRFDGEWYLQ